MSERWVVIDTDTAMGMAEEERRLLKSLPEEHAVEIVPPGRYRRVYRVTTPD